VSERIERFLATALTASAVAVGLVLVHREFFPQRDTVRRGADAETPTVVADWMSAVTNGVIIGNQDARVKITVFSDLECPVCRGYATTLRAVRRAYPTNLALVFVHFPLPQHRFARPAARASECADRAQRFAEFVDVVYTKQDSLGLKTWTSYAKEAGIRDTAAFGRCTSETQPIARIDSGVAVARRLGVNATPTVFVNQWRFASPPSEQELIRMVTAIAEGKRAL